MQCFNRPSLATSIKPRAVCLAVASCLAAALMSAPAASAAVSTAFDPLPFEVPRNAPVTVKLQMTNPDPAAVDNVALGVNASQFLDDGTSPPVTVQGYECLNGTKLTTLPPGTPAGTVACHWDTVAASGGQVAMTVTILPADGAFVSLRGYQSVGGSPPIQVASAITQVARPKADFNVQASAPAQLAVGETGQLKTTLNNVSGDSADGVHQVPRFSLFGFSTRNADVLAVSATAGTCKVEPAKTFDPTSGKQIVVPDMVNISCQGGTLAPGGSITATVTVKGKSPGVVSESPDFFVSGMEDSTPLTRWWEYPQFRVGIYQGPRRPRRPRSSTPPRSIRLSSPRPPAAC